MKWVQTDRISDRIVLMVREEIKAPDFSPLDIWAGLRPCLPDGLPAIGRLGRTVVATGHAMKGVALAPVTGRLVAQLLAGEQPDHDLAPLDPNRF